MRNTYFLLFGIVTLSATQLTAQDDPLPTLPYEVTSSVTPPPVQCNADEYPVQVTASTCQSRVLALLLGVEAPKLFPTTKYEDLAGLEWGIRQEIERQAREKRHFCPGRPSSLCPTHEDWGTAVRIFTSNQFEFFQHTRLATTDALMARLQEITGATIVAAPIKGPLQIKKVVGVSVTSIDGQQYPAGHVVLVLGVDVITGQLLIANSWTKGPDGRATLQGSVALASKVVFNGNLIHEIRRSTTAARPREESPKRKRGGPASVIEPSEVIKRYRDVSDTPTSLGELEDFRVASAYALSLASLARLDAGKLSAQEEFKRQASVISGVLPNTSGTSSQELASLLQSTLAEARRALANSARAEISAVAASPLLDSASLIRLADVPAPAGQAVGTDVKAVLRENAPLLALLAFQSEKASQSLAGLKEVREALQHRAPKLSVPVSVMSNLSESAISTPFGRAVALAGALSKLPDSDARKIANVQEVVANIDQALSAYQSINDALASNDRTFVDKGQTTVKALRTIGRLLPADQQGDFNRALAVADVALTVAALSSGAGSASAALSLSTSIFGGGGGPLGSADSTAGLRQELGEIKKQLERIDELLRGIQSQLEQIDARLYNIERSLSETQRLIRLESRTVIAEIRGGYMNKKNDDWASFLAAVSTSNQEVGGSAAAVVDQLRSDRVRASFDIVLNHLETNLSGLGHPSIAGSDTCASEQLERIRARGEEALQEEAEAIVRALPEPNFAGQAHCVADVLGEIAESLSDRPAESWLLESGAASSLLVPTDATGSTALTRLAFPVAPPLSVAYFLSKADTALADLKARPLRCSLTDHLLNEARPAIRGFGAAAGPYAPRLWVGAYRAIAARATKDLETLSVQDLAKALGPIGTWFDARLRPVFSSRSAVFNHFSSLPAGNWPIPWDTPTLLPIPEEATPAQRQQKLEAFKEAQDWFVKWTALVSDTFGASEQSERGRRGALLNDLLNARDAALEQLTGLATGALAKARIDPSQGSKDFVALPVEHIGKILESNKPVLSHRWRLVAKYPEWATTVTGPRREVAIQFDRAVRRLFESLEQIGNCLQFAQPSGSDMPDGSENRPSSIEDIATDCGPRPAQNQAALVAGPKWDQLNENMGRAQREATDAQRRFLIDMESIADAFLASNRSAQSMREVEDSVVRKWLALRVVERLLEPDASKPRTLTVSDRFARQLKPFLDRFQRARDPGALGNAFSSEGYLGRWRLEQGSEQLKITVLKRWQCGAATFAGLCARVPGGYPTELEGDWFRLRARYTAEERQIGPGDVLATASTVSPVPFDASDLSIGSKEDSFLEQGIESKSFSGVENSGIMYATETFERLRIGTLTSSTVHRSGLSLVIGGWSGLALATGHPLRYAGFPLNPTLSLSHGRLSGGVALAAGPKLRGAGFSFLAGYAITSRLRLVGGWRARQGRFPHAGLVGLSVDLLRLPVND